MAYRYTINYSFGYSDKTSKLSFEELEAAKGYAKSLLLQPTEQVNFMGNDLYISESSVYDTHESKTVDYFRVFFMNREITIAHVAIVQDWIDRIYEDGRNNPLVRKMKDGKLREILSLEIVNLHYFGTTRKNYMLVKTVKNKYSWDQGMPDIDNKDCFIYAYSLQDSETAVLLDSLYKKF